MSENSLNIRQKFINKMISKIASLDADIALLNKVDRKLARKNRLQKGGANVEIKELQQKALVKRLEIEEQNEALKEAIKKASDLTANITKIKDGLETVGKEIDGIKIEADNISNLQNITAPDVDAHNEALLNALGLYNIKLYIDDDTKINTLDITGLNYLNLLVNIINENANLKSMNKTTDVEKLKLLRNALNVNNALPWEDTFTDTYGLTNYIYNKIVKNYTSAVTRKYLF